MGRVGPVILAVAAAYFLYNSVPKAGEPLKVFEWEYFSAAESAISSCVPVEYGTKEPALEHPPLYVHLLSGVMRLSGSGVPAARLTGALLALLTCVPLFLLASRQPGGYVIFVAAAALFLSSPAVIQGSGIIGAADTGLFPPILLFFCWALLEMRRRPVFFWPAAVLFGLCLWAKMTTSAVLPLFFLGWRLTARDWPGLKRELSVFASGSAVFIASWALYCFFVPGMEHFMTPLSYPLPQLAAGLPSGDPARKLLTAFAEAARVAAWLSPFALIAAACLFDRSGAEEQETRGLLLLGAFILLGYTAVRGTGGGFPKYQFPAIALFCLAAGTRLARELRELTRRDVLLVCAATVAAALYHRLVLGDPLLHLQELLRLAAVKGARAALPGAAAGAALYFAPFAIFLFAAAGAGGWRPLRALFLVSLCFAIGYNIPQNTLQRSALYSTTYAYGTSGAGAAVDFIRRRTAPGDPVIGAFETLYAAGNTRALLMPERAWNSGEGFLRYLEEVRPVAVVCGLGTNTPRQQAEVFDSVPVRKTLSAGYVEHVFGSYTVWLTKERN